MRIAQDPDQAILHFSPSSGELPTEAVDERSYQSNDRNLVFKFDKESLRSDECGLGTWQSTCYHS